MTVNVIETNGSKFVFKNLVTVLITLIILGGCQPDDDFYVPFQPPFSELDPTLVDSIVADMTIEEKIGQMLILKSDINQEDFEYLAYEKIQKGQISGVILSGIPLNEFINITDSINQIAPIPLMIGTEEKFLLNNQFTGISQLPDAYTMFALAKDTLKENLQELFIRQIRQMGINLSIGPVIDEFFPKSELDQDAYFADPPSASPMLEILVSLREMGVISIGDQFTQEKLILKPEKYALGTIDYPYQEMIRMGVSGFKVATDIFRNIDQPKYFVRDFFEYGLEFKGLVVSELKDPKDLEELVRGGSDMIIVNGNPQFVFDYLKFATTQELFDIESLDERVKRILWAKSWMKNGLDIEKEWALRKKRKDKNQPLVRSINRPKMPSFTRFNLNKHFNNENWPLLDRQLYELSIVLVNNKNGLLPLDDIYNRKFNLIQYSKSPLVTFERYFETYVSNPEKHFYRIMPGDTIPPPNLNEQATNIILLGEVNLDSQKDTAFINEVLEKAKNTEVVLLNYGDVNNLSPFNLDLSIVQVFKQNRITEQLGAQLLFGALSARGVLPFDVNQHFRADKGNAFKGFRLKFAQAEEVGIAAEKLVSIDAIARSAIDAQAMPGCQVLIAKEGKIIYSKAFGNHQYDFEKPVRPKDLYDIASITKVAATTLAAMKLYEEGQYNLSDRLKEHLELDERSPIRNVRIRDLLIHESGLQPNMPVTRYVYVRDSSFTKSLYFKDTLVPPYTIPVANRFYFNENYQDSLILSLGNLEINKRRGYRYSDVNFVLLQLLIENLVDQPLDEYLESIFYGPMGLKRTLFLPTTKFDTISIVPTQFDDKWRMQLVHGFVHDEAAALLGGVSGNAGLFTNAEELAIIFQMLLNGGTYGGKRYLEKKTIDYFTSSRHGNHRGLGFDKPYAGRNSSLAPNASSSSFGHTGFTGTCVWVDPTNKLVYIFLSNRIHPSRGNYGLIQLRVRERIHQIVYEALNSYNAVVPDLEEDLQLKE